MEHAVPSCAGKGGTRNFHTKSMETLWKSLSSHVWIEGFLDILCSRIKCTVDWQLSCSKIGASRWRRVSGRLCRCRLTGCVADHRVSMQINRSPVHGRSQGVNADQPKPGAWQITGCHTSRWYTPPALQPPLTHLQQLLVYGFGVRCVSLVHCFATVPSSRSHRVW